MVSRKRTREEMEVDESSSEPSMLTRLRSMWQFASLMQYVYIFGKAVKIDDDLDIEELETLCLSPSQTYKLSELGLALLKFVSSHKGLTIELFDEYTRRQYVAKAPQRNPFGTDEAPNKFSEFDIFTKIRVLHQLSTWTLGNPDRIRERMAEKDVEQTQWRMEPLGWDAQDRSYFVLDDDRLYRKTEPPPAKLQPKPSPKKSKTTKSNKRKRTSTVKSESERDEHEPHMDDDPQAEDDGFGGMKWECLAVTLEDYQSFMETIRSRDPNEKAMYKRLKEEVLPVIEKKAEEQMRRAARKQRELENLEKLARAKRSSRIADKQERRREMEQSAEAERKRLTDLAMAKKEQEKQRKLEEARESRMQTREQRQRDREVKRILHEEELARLQENSKYVGSNEARMSERHLKAEMEKREKALAELKEMNEDQWIFDCSVCGVHGENLDDGSHSIACDNCNVWQHSKCHGFGEEQAARDDFHFICNDCKRRLEDAKRPRIPPIKIRLGAKARNAESNGINGMHNGTADQSRAVMADHLATFDRVEIPPREGTAAKSESVAGNESIPQITQPRGHPNGNSVQTAAFSTSGVESAFQRTTGSAESTLNGATVAPIQQLSPPQTHRDTNGYNKPTPSHSPHGFTNGSHLGSSPPPRPHNPFHNSFQRQRPSAALSPKIPSTLAKPNPSSLSQGQEQGPVVSHVPHDGELNGHASPPGLSQSISGSPTKHLQV